MTVFGSGADNLLSSGRRRCAKGTLLDLLEMAIFVAPPDDAFGTSELFGSRVCLSPRVRPLKQWRGAATAMLSHPVRVRSLRVHIPNRDVATPRSRMLFVHVELANVASLSCYSAA
jgi:hypothetical protein